MLLSTLTYSERAKHCSSPLARRLLQLLDEKKTNLALSADVTSAQKLLLLADELGPEICILKTHIDILNDFTPSITVELRRLAHKHSFLLFEDRKFADIGNTVKHQYAGGIYRIVEWADLVNAHSLPGPGIIQGLAEAASAHSRGLLLLAEMSSEGHLMEPDYINSTIKMAEKFTDFAIGFISQHALSPDPHWIYLTPGVKFNEFSDTLGQQYITPEQAIHKNGSDIIIVGRGILKAENPLAEAKKYREQGWLSYLNRCV